MAIPLDLKDDENDELYDELYDVLADVEADSVADDLADDDSQDDVLLDNRGRPISRRRFMRSTPRQLRRSLRPVPQRPKFDRFMGRGRELVEAWMSRRDIFAPTANASVQATLGVLRHGYTNYKSFIQSWMVLMSPYYTKTATSRVTAVGGAETVVTLNANCAGVLFGFGDQALNAEHAPFKVTLTFGGKTLEFVMKPNKTPAGVGILLPNDNLGVAQVGNFNPVVATIAADAIRAGSWAYLETLNAYDIRP